MEIIIGLASGALITAVVALVQQFRLSDKVKGLEAPKEEGQELLKIKGEMQKLQAPVKDHKAQLDELRWQISRLEVKLEGAKTTADELTEKTPDLVVLQPDLDGVTPPTPAEKLAEEAGTVYSRIFLGGITRKYAPAPNRNGQFLERQLTDSPVDRSNYELIIVGPDNKMALYRLMDDPIQLKRAIKTPKMFIIPACELRGRGGIERAQALECSYGVAVKDDKGNWKIIKKSIVKYNMNMPEVYQGYEDELEKQYQQFIPVSKKEFKEKWDSLQTEREALKEEARKLKKAATQLALKFQNLEGKQGDDALVRELVRQRVNELRLELDKRFLTLESKPSREELQIILDGSIQSILSEFKKDLDKDFISMQEWADLPKTKMGGEGGITPQGVRNIIREELIGSGMVNKTELKELFRRYDQRLLQRLGVKKREDKPEAIKDDFNNIRNDFNDAW